MDPRRARGRRPDRFREGPPRQSRPRLCGRDGKPVHQQRDAGRLSLVERRPRLGAHPLHLGLRRGGGSRVSSGGPQCHLRRDVAGAAASVVDHLRGERRRRDLEDDGWGRHMAADHGRAPGRPHRQGRLFRLGGHARPGLRARGGARTDRGPVPLGRRGRDVGAGQRRSAEPAHAPALLLRERDCGPDGWERRLCPQSVHLEVDGRRRDLQHDPERPWR